MFKNTLELHKTIGSINIENFRKQNIIEFKTIEIQTTHSTTDSYKIKNIDTKKGRHKKRFD